MFVKLSAEKVVCLRNARKNVCSVDYEHGGKIVTKIYGSLASLTF